MKKKKKNHRTTKANQAFQRTGWAIEKGRTEERKGVDQAVGDDEAISDDDNFSVHSASAPNNHWTRADHVQGKCVRAPLDARSRRPSDADATVQPRTAGAIRA